MVTHFRRILIPETQCPVLRQFFVARSSTLSILADTADNASRRMLGKVQDGGL
jgi:hypothetical protein